MSPEEEMLEHSPKPHRLWRKLLLYAFFPLIGFVVWANGPGIRWGFKKVILQQLATQELSGSFKIEGTALSGISIHDISLSGESTIQSIESDLIQVGWSLGSLINKELETIDLRRLNLVIDPKALNPSSSEGAIIKQLGIGRR